jgi:hypothetical protein
MIRPPVILHPRALFLALLLAGASAPSTAPAPLAPDRGSPAGQQRKQRLEQYESMRQSVSEMPPVAARSVDDLFRLRIKGPDLALENLVSNDPSKEESYRVELPQFRGPTSVTIATVPFREAFLVPPKGGAPDPAAADAVGQYRAFSLSSLEMPDGDTLVELEVVALPGQLHVQRKVYSSASSRTVMVVQQRLAEGVRAPDAPAVTVSVRDFSTNPGRVRGNVPPPVNQVLLAKDFQTLLREHPAEVEEHVRPLLRAVGQEALFAPDEMVAWQVFAERWKPDPGVLKKVRAILPSLDHPDYRTRENAVRELEALGKPGAAALVGMDRTGFSPERNLLIDRALAPFNRLKPEEAERLRSDAGFLLDCLFSADAEIRAAALERLKKHAGAQIKFDLNAPAPERAAAAAALREKLLPVAATTRPTTQPAKS